MSRSIWVRLLVKASRVNNFGNMKRVEGTTPCMSRVNFLCSLCFIFFSRFLTIEEHQTCTKVQFLLAMTPSVDRSSVITVLIQKKRVQPLVQVFRKKYTLNTKNKIPWKLQNISVQFKINTHIKIDNYFSLPQQPSAQTVDVMSKIAEITHGPIISRLLLF